MQYNSKHFTIPVDFILHLKELNTQKSTQVDWLMFFVSKHAKEMEFIEVKSILNAG